MRARPVPVMGDAASAAMPARPRPVLTMPWGSPEYGLNALLIEEAADLAAPAISVGMSETAFATPVAACLATSVTLVAGLALIAATIWASVMLSGNSTSPWPGTSMTWGITQSFRFLGCICGWCQE